MCEYSTGTAIVQRGYSARFGASHNKQLQRTVIPQHVRAASASLHYALAARIKRQRAAAELRRYAPHPGQWL
jgi:hypothetical protein